MNLTTEQRQINHQECINDFLNGFVQAKKITKLQLCLKKFEKVLIDEGYEYSKITEQVKARRKNNRIFYWTRIVGFENCRTTGDMLCGISFTRKCYHKNQCHFFDEDRCNVQ